MFYLTFYTSVVLLYAHWEGFIKRILTMYLNHVIDQGLRNCDLKPNFYALSLRPEFEDFKKTKSSIHYIRLTSIIFEKTNEISHIQSEKIIDTRSNLNSELFKELMSLLDLDSSIHDTSFNLIDERLLKRRNGIAHGENRRWFPLNKNEYIDIHDRIVAIINDLAEQISTAAITQQYLASCDEECNTEISHPDLTPSAPRI